MRITRILKCLGDFEFEKYQIEWLKFLIQEIFVTRKLAKLDTSLANYWIHTIKNDEDRNGLITELESIINEQSKD